jgi:hypothetical protein
VANVPPSRALARLLYRMCPSLPLWLDYCIKCPPLSHSGLISIEIRSIFSPDLHPASISPASSQHLASIQPASSQHPTSIQPASSQHPASNQPASNQHPASIQPTSSQHPNMHNKLNYPSLCTQSLGGGLAKRLNRRHKHSNKKTNELDP